MPTDAPLRVSVIVPSHNDADMLEHCLDALAKQTRPADEIIVVDNASTDATAEVARAAGATVVPEPIRGVTPATARGFDSATGDILARLDADSVPPADWIERIIVPFQADPNLSGLSGPGEFYGSNRAVHWIAENLYIGGYRWFCSWLLGHPPLFGSNLVIRASAWQRLSGKVHRTRREVHDDLDLSYNIEPDMEVRWDPTLKVGVSARPFESASGLWRRVRWAYITIRLNWERPAVRRAARQRVREELEQARAA